MTSSVNGHNSYGSGQEAGRWPIDHPLALRQDSFVPDRKGHPPPGTVPEEIVPEGRQKPKLFDAVQLPVTKSLVLKNSVVVR